MIPKAAEVRLSPEDRAVLEARVWAPTTRGMAWPVWQTNRVRVPSRNIMPRRASAFWPSSNGRRLAGSRAGRDPLIAAEVGDVHVQQVWRFLRAQKIDRRAQIVVREQ